MGKMDAGAIGLQGYTTGHVFQIADAETIGFAAIPSHTHQGAGQGGQLDHGLALTGLLDDDHTIYALLSGRSGGQVYKGGLGAGETLTLQSTAHATKGKILFGTSAYDEVNNRLGIGTVSPQRRLDVSSSGQITFGDNVVTDASQGIYWHSGTDYAIYRKTGAWVQPLNFNFATGIDFNTGTYPITMIAQQWQITASATTGHALQVIANSLTSGSALHVSSNSTAALTGNPLAYLSVSGANASASITRYALYAINTASGTTSTNIGGYFSASGATTNYGLIVENGGVGIGITSPLNKGTGDLTISRLFVGNTDTAFTSGETFHMENVFTDGVAFLAERHRLDANPPAASALNFQEMSVRVRTQGTYNFSGALIAFNAGVTINSSGGVSGQARTISLTGVAFDADTPANFGTIALSQVLDIYPLFRSAGNPVGTVSLAIGARFRGSSTLGTGPITLTKIVSAYFDSQTLGGTNRDILHDGASPYIEIATGATLRWVEPSGLLLMSLVDASGGGAGAGNWTLTGALAHQGNTAGFFGTAPVTKPTALTAQLTTITHTAPGTPDYAIADLVLNGYGFVAADEGRTVLSVIANLQTRLAQLENRQQALGLLS